MKSCFISMFLFNLFILLGYSKSFNLNQAIFDDVMKIKNRLPLFIEIWDPHCHNCQSFKSEWEKLTSIDFFQKRIIFGDVNCISEKNFCQKISPGKEFPRFVWYDSNKTTSQSYTGSYTLPDLVLWLKSQLQNSIEVINDTEKFEKIQQISLKIPLFRFTINESDKKSYQIISSSVEAVKHLQIKMILKYSNQSQNATVELFSPDNRIITMRNEFSYQNIIKFIKAHSIRFLSLYNDLFGRFSFTEKVPIMVFAYSHDNLELRKKAINSAKAIHNLSLIPVTQLSCSYNPIFCRYYGIKDDSKKITVIIINKYRNVFWFYEHLSDIKALQVWLINVLRNRVRPFGPGTAPKLLQPTFEMFYELRGQGGLKYYLFFVPIIGGIMFTITLALHLSMLSLEKKPNTKLKKN